MHNFSSGTRVQGKASDLFLKTDLGDFGYNSPPDKNPNVRRAGGDEKKSVRTCRIEVKSLDEKVNMCV